MEQRSLSAWSFFRYWRKKGILLSKRGTGWKEKAKTLRRAGAPSSSKRTASLRTRWSRRAGKTASGSSAKTRSARRSANWSRSSLM